MLLWMNKIHLVTCYFFWYYLHHQFGTEWCSYTEVQDVCNKTHNNNNNNKKKQRQNTIKDFNNNFEMTTKWQPQ